MSETPKEAFGDEASTGDEQNFEINPEGADPKDIDTQFDDDQAGEIDPGADEPLEPGGSPVEGG